MRKSSCWVSMKQGQFLTFQNFHFVNDDLCLKECHGDQPWASLLYCDLFQILFS